MIEKITYFQTKDGAKFETYEQAAHYEFELLDFENAPIRFYDYNKNPITPSINANYEKCFYVHVLENDKWTDIEQIIDLWAQSWEENEDANIYDTPFSEILTNFGFDKADLFYWDDFKGVWTSIINERTDIQGQLNELTKLQKEFDSKSQASLL